MPSTIEALAHFPVSDHDPYARECTIDPYPLHAALRNLAPVVRLRKYDCWAVSRSDDVVKPMRAPGNYGTGKALG
jgi:hypothetical protein